MLEIKKTQLRNSLILAMACLTAGYVGCGSTGGGQGKNDAGLGTHPVSDGGFGAKLTISLADGTNEIETGGTKDFFVIATDPNGLPLAERRVFCESEKGLAIVEPSSGGVAFEHTNADGKMSGVLGGASPGSYLLECRLEEGFNLIARKHFKITGDVPPGFNGFLGAAGGNLGGGVIVPNPNAQVGDVEVTSIGFNVLGEAAEINPGLIDLGQDTDCSNDGSTTTDDIEPYGFDQVILHLKNPLSEAVTIDEVQITINNASDPETTLGVTTVVPALTTDQEVAVAFSDFPNSNSTKYLAGLPGVAANQFIAGTYNVTFDISGETASGEDINTSVSTAVTFAQIDRCE